MSAVDAESVRSRSRLLRLTDGRRSYEMRRALADGLHARGVTFGILTI